MNQIQPLPVTAGHLLSEFDPRTSVIFGKRARLLVTDGVFTQITTPAVDGDRSDGKLQSEIRQAMQRAKKEGIEHPIVVGALPFDVSRPSCLVIPRRWRIVAVTSSAGHTASASGATWKDEAAGQSGRDEFQKSVRELLNLLQDGALRKVVLSRMLEVEVDKDTSLQKIIGHLLHAEDEAYRFSVPLAENRTLVGVSPELLVRKSAETIESNPLAGSVPRRRYRDKVTAACHLLNSQKDLIEHQVVVEQVRHTLAAVCSDLDAPERPSVIGTNALFHLSTAMKGRLRDSSQNALSLACSLHPTPAVCGYPREPAREAIGRIEPFERGLFTGATGWMDEHGDGEWAVTIRCGVVSPDRVRIFAGAGIVQGSDPELEWEETSTKLQPMLQTLGLLAREDS